MASFSLTSLTLVCDLNIHAIRLEWLDICLWPQCIHHKPQLAWHLSVTSMYIPWSLNSLTFICDLNAHGIKLDTYLWPQCTQHQAWRFSVTSMYTAPSLTLACDVNVHSIKLDTCLWPQCNYAPFLMWSPACGNFLHMCTQCLPPTCGCLLVFLNTVCGLATVPFTATCDLATVPLQQHVAWL